MCEGYSLENKNNNDNEKGLVPENLHSQDNAFSDTIKMSMKRLYPFKIEPTRVVKRQRRDDCIYISCTQTPRIPSSITANTKN